MCTFGITALHLPTVQARGAGGGSGDSVTHEGEHPLVHQDTDIDGLEDNYLRLDTTNDPMQGNLDFNNNDINDVNKICFDSDNDTCLIKSGGLLKVFVENVLQVQWPITTVGVNFLYGSTDSFLFGSGDNFEFGS